MMLFIFVLPVMQVILFCLAIGRDPTGLRLAISNMEMNDTIVSTTTPLDTLMSLLPKIARALICYLLLSRIFSTVRIKKNVVLKICLVAI